MGVLLLALLTGAVIADAARAQPASKPSSGFPMTMQEARRFFACRTLMSFDPGHGTQVFFMRPDGTEFLWYPGNTVVLASKRRLAPRREGAPHLGVDLCFQHGTDTYNPVTKQPGGQWECRPAHVVARTVVEGASGDALGLSRRLPFVLSRERTSIEALQKLLRGFRPEEAQRDAADEQACGGQTS